MNNKNKTITLTMLAIAALVWALPILAAQAQEPQTSVVGLQPYVDAENAFRLNVPAGWITSNEKTDENAQDKQILEILDSASGQVVGLCPQSSAEHKIGEGLQCTYTASSKDFTVGIDKYYFDLPQAIQFADVIEDGRNVTTDDLLAYELTQLRGRFGYMDVQVVSEVNNVTNLVDAETGEIIANNVPTKTVEVSYIDSNFGPPARVDQMMFAVWNNPEGNSDPETGVKAFLVNTAYDNADVQNTPVGTTLQRPDIKEIFSTFELVE
jgi:hypothetical protein